MMNMVISDQRLIVDNVRLMMMVVMRNDDESHDDDEYKEEDDDGNYDEGDDDDAFSVRTPTPGYFWPALLC